MPGGLSRRNCLKVLGATALAGPARLVEAGMTGQAKPNVILCMADDQGWGDTGYNGHKVLKTSSLDAMSREGMRFDRWYSGAPVCSPTRGSCLTGRHPYRYGIFFANVGHMRPDEITLAEVLKAQGYTTGHFGKWHLGTMRPDYSGKGPRRRPGQNHATPGMNGFDEWFSTEFAVATWNPYDPAVKHTKTYDTRNLYWHNGRNVEGGLEGCDSRIIMDKALPFIRGAARAGKPFLAVIWFHAPHAPVVAGLKYRRMYAGQSEGRQHYYGCITAMDEQIGRLRAELGALGVAGNTMLWYCSDNGPEGKRASGRTQGSAGPFRGRKRSLYEGGVRVPGLLVWPDKITKPRPVKMPCCTSDYFPTVLEVLGYTLAGKPRPYDGVSLLPLIEGNMTKRPRPIGFESGGQVSLTDNRYKLIRPGRKGGKGGKSRPFELYDLVTDPGETKDIAAAHADLVNGMAATLRQWRASCKRSLDGKDY